MRQPSIFIVQSQLNQNIRWEGKWVHFTIHTIRILSSDYPGFCGTEAEVLLLLLLSNPFNMIMHVFDQAVECTWESSRSRPGARLSESRVPDIKHPVFSHERTPFVKPKTQKKNKNLEECPKKKC